MSNKYIREEWLKDFHEVIIFSYIFIQRFLGRTSTSLAKKI